MTQPTIAPPAQSAGASHESPTDSFFVTARSRTGGRKQAPVRKTHCLWHRGALVIVFEIGHPVGSGRGYTVEVEINPLWMLTKLTKGLQNIGWPR